MASKKKKSAEIEWIGGLVELPADAIGEGETARPAAIFWLSADGVLLGSSVAAPSELLTEALDSFKTTIEEPLEGEPHTPTHVRVSSRELAEMLRKEFPAIEVTHAPTPEMDQALEDLLDELNAEADGEQSYLAEDVGPEQVAEFFAATATLFRADPWALSAREHGALAVNIDALGVRDAVLAIAGQKGEGVGLMLFARAADFDAYVAQSRKGPLADPGKFPPHSALSFERGEDLPPELLDEVETHQWEVADADSYPWVVMLDAGLEARAPSAAEVAVIAAVSRAIAGVDRAKLESAWNSGAMFTQTVRVARLSGEVEVALQTLDRKPGPKDN